MLWLRVFAPHIAINSLPRATLTGVPQVVSLRDPQLAGGSASENSQFELPSPPLALLYCSEFQKNALFFTFLHFSASPKMLSLLFSSPSTLFAQNTGGMASLAKASDRNSHPSTSTRTKRCKPNRFGRLLHKPPCTPGYSPAAGKERLPGDLAGCGQHLLGAGTDANVFREVLPADGAGAVHEKFGGTRDVGSLRATGMMQDVVAANHFGFGIAEKGEAVTLLPAEIFRNLGRVYADRHWPDALRSELGQIVLDASQLEVAIRSPVAAIENEQHGFGLRGAGRRGRKQLRQRDGSAGAVRQREVRHALPDFWSAPGARYVSRAVEEQNGPDANEQRERRDDRAPNFAAIHLRFAESTHHTNEQHQQREDGKDQIQPRQQRRGDVEEIEKIAGDGEKEQQQTQPESGIAARLRSVRHEGARLARARGAYNAKGRWKIGRGQKIAVCARFGLRLKKWVR
jgi:hypothetical protein